MTKIDLTTNLDDDLIDCAVNNEYIESLMFDRQCVLDILKETFLYTDLQLKLFKEYVVEAYPADAEGVH